MSSSEKNGCYLEFQHARGLENDPYGAIECVAEMIWERAEYALKTGEVSRISDEAVTQLMTTAIKLYAAKVDGEERTFRPLLGHYDEVVSPTEALTSVTEILRALRLGPMEFGLWSRRRPEDYHETDHSKINVVGYSK